jgi:hypothetical protein
MGNTVSGQADALAAAQQAGAEHFCVDTHVAGLDHAQLQLAVVEQQRVALLHGFKYLGVGQLNAAQIAHVLAADEAQNVTLSQADRSGVDLADAELGSL